MRACVLALLLGACVLSGDDIPPPVIAALVPPRSAAGTTVTVEGDHFCPVPSTGSDTDPPICDGGVLRFGSTTTTTTRWTGTAIDAVVPPLLPGTYDVTITIGGRSSNTAPFEVTP
ncbi:MAG TPA: IPT/TIG domain-containing protein [Kofleriaceae bacterium]|nr:IPT/TIG domain-containing protein [Kofleriaceae bacterium]